MTQPSLRSRLITGASSVAGSRGRMTPPAVVTMPATSTRSLTATTVPLPASDDTEMKALRSARSRMRWRAFSRSISPILAVGELFSLAMPQTSGAINPTVAWTKVEVLTAYQRLSGEIQMQVRLRETINDPEPYFHLRYVSAETLVPGAVALNGVPEGLFSKALIGGIRTIETEPPPPAPIMEMILRY